MKPSVPSVFSVGPGITVSFSGGITEDLPLTHLEGNQYRVEFSSLLAEPRVFYGDVIEIAPTGDTSADFVRVAKRSGFRVFCRLIGKEIIKSPSLQTLLDRIMQLGGNWEKAFGGVLIVHLPASVEFNLDDELEDLTRAP